MVETTLAVQLSELRALLHGPGVPRKAVDCVLNFLKRPGECLSAKPVVAPACGADGVEVSFHASDRLIDLIAAARAGEWERIISGKFEGFRLR